MKQKLIKLEKIKDIKKNKISSIKKNYEGNKKAFKNSQQSSIARRNDELKFEISVDENIKQSKMMEDIRKEIDGVQEKIKEIKETNQFEVPREIRYIDIHIAIMLMFFLLLKRLMNLNLF